MQISKEPTATKGVMKEFFKIFENSMIKEHRSVKVKLLFYSLN